MTTNFMGGLRRRNNELNELTNFLGGEELGRSTVAHFARKVSYSAIAATFAASALKGQQVPSPGQRPGYHVPIPYAL